VSVSDLAIVAALVFGWGTLSARLERFDVTAPIAFVVAGLLLTHGPLLSAGRAPVRSGAAPAQAHPPKARNPVAPEIASLAGLERRRDVPQRQALVQMDQDEVLERNHHQPQRCGNGSGEEKLPTA
jgi:hypothetical protein